MKFQNFNIERKEINPKELILNVPIIYVLIYKQIAINNFLKPGHSSSYYIS